MTKQRLHGMYSDVKLRDGTTTGWKQCKRQARRVFVKFVSESMFG